uniref:B30.2/SPRY domain-containing protein n=1 Tax=Aureoumbra lagunensis TaxID=44058 RepID=A0A7S3JNR0_9STRA|mmetsp:Transcript_18023/g.27157  ORF Transcript_18023/g.27157 Transcript_18023/m.27157 type:complete len:369 (+) Transcript_18023:61-1167(+)
MPVTRQSRQQVLKPKRKKNKTLISDKELKRKRKRESSGIGKEIEQIELNGEVSKGRYKRKRIARKPSGKRPIDSEKINDLLQQNEIEGSSSINDENRTKNEEKIAVLLSDKDKAPQLTLLSDQLRVRGSGGYSMIRGTHGSRRGQWYYECSPRSSRRRRRRERDCHFRIGWAQKFTSVQGPVGMDHCSFAYCDNGASYSSGERNDDYGNAWQIRSKCTIGCFIDIDAKQIRFFYNGQDQGCAFISIPRGAYFPAVSIYGPGSLKINFGPQFKFSPLSHTYNPISDLALTRQEDACFISDIKSPKCPRLSLDDEDDEDAEPTNLTSNLHAHRQQRFTSTLASLLLDHAHNIPNLVVPSLQQENNPPKEK